MVQVNPAHLRQRIDDGLSVRVIARELGVTERRIRNHLRRLGIPLPSVVKAARIDLDDVFAAYRTGEPVVRIAERHSVSSSWVTARVAEHGIERDVPIKRKPPPPRYAELDDRLWLLERLAEGLSVYAVARGLRTGRRTVVDALQRHGITWPPADADPVERLAYIDDAEVRARAAQRILDGAWALAERARAACSGLRPEG